jgi:surfeit locus 1 family protein
MQKTARQRLLMVLLSLPVLAALLALGQWQVRRLHWKLDLLDAIAAAESGPATPLPPNPAPYTKVAATGRFDHGREVLLGIELRGTTLGAHLVAPLLRDAAAPILVDRGWVPMTRGPGVDQGIDRPEGPVAVTGYIRPVDTRDWNSPADDLPGRRFYVFDPPVIGAALGLPTPEPFALVALAAPGTPPGRLPEAARTLPRPDNPHLGYAITWFGLAAALVGVVAVFTFRRGR